MLERAAMTGYRHRSVLAAACVGMLLVGVVGRTRWADISTGRRAAGLAYLGVFFGIGAFGVPLLLGLLRDRFGDAAVVAGIGVLVALVPVYYVAIHFPPPSSRRASRCDGRWDCSAIPSSFGRKRRDQPLGVARQELEHEVDVVGEPRFAVDDGGESPGDHVGDAALMEGTEQSLEQVRWRRHGATAGRRPARPAPADPGVGSGSMPP